MTKQHGVDAAGVPVDLIGRPLVPGLGSTPGLTVIREEQKDTMVKASTRGTYTLHGARYRIKAGDVLPTGAVLDEQPAPVVDEEPDTDGKRKKGPAPDNRALAPAPENRAG